MSDSLWPCIAARQASLSITNSQSSLKPMWIELVMPSSHLILCSPLLLLPPIFPSIKLFSNESTLHMSIGVSASASVLPMNTQDWFPLGWTGWISLQIIEKAREFQKNIYFCFIDMPKPLTVWITINCENSERDGNTRPPDLPLEKPICRSGRYGYSSNIRVNVEKTPPS